MLSAFFLHQLHNVRGIGRETAQNPGCMVGFV